MSVFITCAVTGSGDTAAKSSTSRHPQQIADSAIEARQGRGRGRALPRPRSADRGTGARCRPLREVTDRVRSSDTDVVLNLTTGMGGDIVIGSVEQPLPLDPEGTDSAARPSERSTSASAGPRSARSTWVR